MISGSTSHVKRDFLIWFFRDRFQCENVFFYLLYSSTCDFYIKNDCYRVPSKVRCRLRRTGWLIHELWRAEWARRRCGRFWNTLSVWLIAACQPTATPSERPWLTSPTWSTPWRNSGLKARVLHRKPKLWLVVSLNAWPTCLALSARPSRTLNAAVSNSLLTPSLASWTSLEDGYRHHGWTIRDLVRASK